MDRQITRRDLLSGAAVGAGMAFLGDSAAGQGNKPPEAGKHTPKKSAGDIVPPAGQVLDTIKIGMFRTTPTVGGYSTNWTTFSNYATQAKTAGCNILMGCECFLDGYAAGQGSPPWTRSQVMAAGRTCATTYLPQAQALAASKQMMLLVGMTYTVDPKCWNSAFLIGTDGSIIGRYDKNHLLDHDTKFDPGTALPVFDTTFGKVGIMICADRRWPECPRTLRAQGARLILTPTYGFQGTQNEEWMRTRAYENECWICFAHPNRSSVFNPQGNAPSPNDSGSTGLTTVTLNLAGSPTTLFNARRPALYAPLVAPKPAPLG